MRTKRFVCIFTVFVLFVAVSCSSPSTHSTINDTVAKSALNRDTNPQVTDDDLSAAAGGVTDFGLKAFPLLVSDPDTNAVFSPYSIAMAVAMAAAGANGTTLSGIETAMSFTLPQDRLNPAFNKLDLILASETTGTVHKDGSLSPRLNLVNAIWAQDGFPLLPAYLDSIAVNFGAGLHLVDYIHAPEDARKTINAWVENQTNNRIPELMPQGTVGDTTRVVLTNAIWFKANWSSKFPVENTKNGTFFNNGSSPAVVSFMSQTFTVPAAANSDYQAVDIPYVDGKLSMLMVMPAAGTFDSFLAEFTPAKLSGIVDQLVYQETVLSLPKFSFSTGVDLKSVLASLGMTAAFDPDIADFSGIDGSRDLFIQAAVHKAFINVDENGTEAAAATALGAGTTGYIEPQIFVNIDHPFIFMIRDRQTGLILFMGKVVTLPAV